MELTWTNTVFSRITLVSYFCVEIKVLGKIWKNSRNFYLAEDPRSQKGRCGRSPRLPSEITNGSPRVLAFKEAEVDELRNDDLLLLEGLRRNAALTPQKRRSVGPWRSTPLDFSARIPPGNGGLWVPGGLPP